MLSAQWLLDNSTTRAKVEYWRTKRPALDAGKPQPSPTETWGVLKLAKRGRYRTAEALREAMAEQRREADRRSAELIVRMQARAEERMCNLTAGQLWGER